MSNQTIQGKKLQGLVNKKMRHRIDEGVLYPLRSVDADSLLSHDRFDLVPKIIYATHRMRGLEAGWPTEGYLEHISRINGFVESDGSRKHGADDFIQAFNTLIASIATTGFDSNYPVPLSDGAPLDGAHRIACAIALRTPIKVVDIDGVSPHRLNAVELESLGIAPDYLDHWAVQYAKLKPTARLVFVWPSAASNDSGLDLILRRHGSVVHKKYVRLSPRGQVNIVRSVYKCETWVGSVADGFVGASNKAKWCFGESGPLRVFLMDGVSDWLALKNDIRALFKIEKSSVHINDTHQETCEFSELIFNPNGLQFLDRHIPAQFTWLTDLRESFHAWLRACSADASDYCFVGSAVLGIYGVREPRDLDFIAVPGAAIDTGMKEVDCHSGGSEDWGVAELDIIIDPRHHFIAGHCKYLAPQLLVRQKTTRGESKDHADIKALMEVLSGANQPTYRAPVTLALVKARLKFYLLKLRFYARRRLVRNSS